MARVSFHMYRRPDQELWLSTWIFPAIEQNEHYTLEVLITLKLQGLGTEPRPVHQITSFAVAVIIDSVCRFLISRFHFWLASFHCEPVTQD